jgi:hypothetical protein
MNSEKWDVMGEIYPSSRQTVKREGNDQLYLRGPVVCVRTD